MDSEQPRRFGDGNADDVRFVFGHTGISSEDGIIVNTRVDKIVTWGDLHALTIAGTGNTGYDFLHAK